MDALFGSLLSTAIGGIIALAGVGLNNYYTEKRKSSERQVRQVALYSGLYAIRNFIAEKLNEFEDNPNSLRPIKNLRIAQKGLTMVIGKSPLDSQAMMMILVDLEIRLEDLIETAKRLPSKKSEYGTLTEDKRNALDLALDMFNINTAGVLEYVNIEDFVEMPAGDGED